MKEAAGPTLLIVNRIGVCIAALSPLVIAGCRDAPTAAMNVRPDTEQVTTTAPAWPALFGPHRNCVAEETGLTPQWGDKGPPLTWERNIGMGYSSPVIAQDHVIVFHRESDQEIIESLDAATGSSLWTYKYPSTYKCRYDYSDGPYSTPAIDNKRVYALGAQGWMHALSLADGTKIWSRDLHSEYQVEEGLFAAGATPLVIGDRLILCLGGQEADAGMIALDANTGSTLWTATDHRASYAMPCYAQIHGQEYVFAMTFEGLVALDPQNGQVFWDYPFRSKAPDSVNATSPLVLNDYVLIVTGPGPGSVCLRVLADGSYQETWRDRRVLDSQFNSLLLDGNYVYGFTAKRQGGAQFRCVDFVTGRLRWKFASALERGSVLASDGILFLLGESGHLASMRLDTEKATLVSMSEPILAAPCYSAIALYDKHLYVRNEQRILCLDVESKPK